MQLRELAEAKAKARGAAVKRPVARLCSSKNKPPPLTAPSGSSSGAFIESECCWQVGKQRLLL